ncbi:hypothetical protein Golob_019514, partial [Gossypium lobatum]|nr:hypothetical protein [Gossypium lobatum]
VYVKNVAKSVDFYAKACGYNVHRLWGELESGQSTIAFTPKHQLETDKLTGAVPRSDRERPPMGLCFVSHTSIPLTRFRAVSVSQPENKEWGQRVGYVRDIDGIAVMMEAMFTHQNKLDLKSNKLLLLLKLIS